MNKNFKNRFNILILVIFIIFLFEQNFYILNATQVFNINELIEIMKQKYSSIEDYEGTIVYFSKTKSDSIANENEGKIYYKFPNKLRVSFEKPYQWEIVTNGKFLWVYISSIFAVIKQDLSKIGTLDFENSKKSLSYLLNNYSFKFLTDGNLSQFNQFKVYKIIGYPISPNAGFAKLELYVRDDGFIVYQAGTTKSGKVVVYYFKNVSFNVSLADNFFEYENFIPSNVQIIDESMN
ncbi:MAG: outer-membrane lipoprotein carrier protein LolA [Spirochaetes bacterium]|nr:outer-membrane lipoprotein carrier protein LolA [Spirochaetota bacterium]